MIFVVFIIVNIYHGHKFHRLCTNCTKVRLAYLLVLCGAATRVLDILDIFGWSEMRCEYVYVYVIKYLQTYLNNLLVYNHTFK